MFTFVEPSTFNRYKIYCHQKGLIKLKPIKFIKQKLFQNKQRKFRALTSLNFRNFVLTLSEQYGYYCTCTFNF